MNNKWSFFLFIIGLMIFLYPHMAVITHNHIQKSQVQQFKSMNQSLQPKQISDRLTSAQKCNEAIFENKEKLHDPFTEEFNHHDFKQCTNIPSDGEHFASLEIPKLNLEIPIYLGASENELSKGIGQIEGSSLPIGGTNTHTVLAGHRGMGTKAMFRNLDELDYGDSFYIFTINEKLQYIVNDIKVILPTETDNLHISEGEDLTSLITCHPYRSNSHRLVVQGKRKQ